MRAIIVDDHNIVRAGLRSVLLDIKGVDVVGEADDGRSAIKMARALKPDLILMDLSMPGMNGFLAISEIIGEFPGARIIVLSMLNDASSVTSALKSGAMGYLAKDCGSEELARAIAAVASGRVYLSESLSQMVVNEYANSVRKDQRCESQLTPKESQVLQLLAEGKTNKDIAEIMNISVKTVEKHRSNIMNKLDMHNIASLTKYAIREGISSLT